MVESHGVNREDRDSHGQKDDTDTVTIAESEHTSALPYYVDWNASLQDFENTDPLQSRGQQSPEQGNDDAVSVGIFDEEVFATLGGYHRCDQLGCSRRFITRRALLRHAVLHRRENKGHKCDQCHMKFPYPKDVRRHQKTHGGIKSEACEFDGCAKVFSRKDNLRRHMKAIHVGRSAHDLNEAVIGPPVQLLSFPCSVEPPDDFGHDDKELPPLSGWDFDSQDVEASLQGDRGETCQRSEATEELAHCQGGHEPSGHVDGNPVHSDALLAPEFRKSGTVIPCPLPCPSNRKKECSGKDENMASLLRKLRSQYHGIYYHNQCKKLLSAPSLHPSDDTEQFRKIHEENERLWSSHTEECHAKFCVLAECAPNQLGDLRHERNGSCNKTRGDVKQAEFNYLCHTLGVSQRNIEIGIKHDHSGQRNAPRNSRASLPIVKTEQDVLKPERNDTSSEDDNTRLTKEVERLRGSIETLEKDRAEHISIMRHLVHDMLQNHVELSDVVRERLDRHAPSVLHKPTPAHHVHNYPYTPRSSSATPTIVKRERDSILDTRWTHSPSGALAQDLPRGEHPSSLFPAKRQRTDSTGPGDPPLSIVPDSQSARCTPMSMTDLPPPFDQHIRKQVVPGLNHGQSSPGHQYTKQSWSELNTPSVPTNYQETPTIAGEDEYIRQRPAPDFVHPGGTNLPPSIASASENLSFQYNDDFPDLFAPVTAYQAGDKVLNVDPELERQDGMQSCYTTFADYSFNLCGDWTSFDNSHPH